MTDNELLLALSEMLDKKLAKELNPMKQDIKILGDEIKKTNLTLGNEINKINLTLGNKINRINLILENEIGPQMKKRWKQLLPCRRT